MNLYQHIVYFSQSSSEYHNFNRFTDFMKGVGSRVKSAGGNIKGRFQGLSSDLRSNKEAYAKRRTENSQQFQRDMNSARRLGELGRHNITTGKVSRKELGLLGRMLNRNEAKGYKEQIKTGKDQISRSKTARKEGMSEYKTNSKLADQTYKQGKKDAWRNFWHYKSPEASTPTSNTPAPDLMTAQAGTATPPPSTPAPPSRNPVLNSWIDTMKHYNAPKKTPTPQPGGTTVNYTPTASSSSTFTGTPSYSFG